MYIEYLTTTNGDSLHPLWWFLLLSKCTPLGHWALKSKVDNGRLDRLGVLQPHRLAGDWRRIGMFMPICSWSQFFLKDRFGVMFSFGDVVNMRNHLNYLNYWTFFYLDFLLTFLSFWHLIMKYMIQLGGAGMSAMLSGDNCWFSLLRTASSASGKSLSTWSTDVDHMMHSHWELFGTPKHGNGSK